jgi:hypothetical protein
MSCGMSERFGRFKLTALTILVGMTCFVYVWQFHDQSIRSKSFYRDEGYETNSARRVLKGEVMYKDFPYGMMPMSVYARASLMHLFGEKLVVGRILWVVAAALATMVFFRLSLSLLRPSWATVVATALTSSCRLLRNIDAFYEEAMKAGGARRTAIWNSGTQEGPGKNSCVPGLTIVPEPGNHAQGRKRS